jgi:citrate lyase alpha subunit
VLSQALISLTGFRRVAAGWTSGGIVFVVVTLLGSQLFLRVEVGLLCGAAMSVAVMSVLLAPLLRSRITVETGKRIATAET